jgi:hypothetical protein
MLISRRDGTLTLVTQPDHGRLAGELARHWGNGEFARAPFPEEFLFTAAHHDDGWNDLDAAPMWAEQHLRPAHFLELPLPMVAAAFTTAIDAVYEASPLAGALHSMHFTGFYRSRWGVDDAPFVDHPDVADIVEHEERRRARAIHETWPADGPRADFERRLWHAYEILQALDLLSLFACLVDVDRESTADAQVMARTLFSIDQEPNPRTIRRCPINDIGDRVDLAVSVAAPGVVAVDPYPFATPELAVEVPMRVLADEPYRSADAAAAAYHAAPVQLRRLSVVDANAPSTANESEVEHVRH